MVFITAQPVILFTILDSPTLSQRIVSKLLPNTHITEDTVFIGFVSIAKSPSIVLETRILILFDIRLLLFDI